MLSFPKVLQSLSREELLELIDAYYVRYHSGRGPSEDDDLYEFISNWVLPDSGPVQEGNILEAIRNGVKFDPQTDEDVVYQIFGDQIFVSSSILEDFANYPMREAFETDPWELLQGYISSQDRDEYFQQITGENPANFLNHTEKIFYLTRGYGRPNPYISQTDLEHRKFYQEAEPSALIALMDILGVCPGRQWPDFILEKLSGFDLQSIDSYHRGAVELISDCMKGATCTSQGCDPEKVQCFQKTLRDLGILDTVEYDPEHEVYRSNLNQIREYQKVVPEKKWSFDEIKDMQDSFVSGTLRMLSDQELLRIEVPMGYRFEDEVDVSSLEKRRRSSLIQQAEDFLLTSKYFLGDSKIYYGKLSQSQLQEFSKEDLEKSIQEHQALLGPQGKSLSLIEAQNVNQVLNSSIIANEISRTQSQIQKNVQILNDLKEKDEEHYEGLRDFLEEKLKKIEEDGEINKVIDELSYTDEIQKLILWSEKRYGWDAVAITFEEYFNQWRYQYPDIFTDTLKYYIQAM